MSYEKQTWQNGDIITADKLNHMEDGISESGSGEDSGVVGFPISLAGPIEIANASNVYEALTANKYVYFHASIEGTNLRFTPMFWDSSSLGIIGLNLKAQEPDFTPVTLIFNHIISGDKFQLQSD